jgi:outer membrane protein assembly factor BamB
MRQALAWLAAAGFTAALLLVGALAGKYMTSVLHGQATPVAPPGTAGQPGGRAAGQGGAAQVALPVVPVGPDSRGDWWMFGHDARHTGRSAFRGPRSATLKWVFCSSGPGADCNTVALGADGAVYTTSGSQLIALGRNGEMRWKCDRPGSLSALVLAPDGTLYVIEDQLRLCAISSAGQLQWAYEFPKTVYAMPVLGSDGNVLVGCTDNSLYAIDKQGKVAWRYEGGEYYTISPRLGSDGLIYLLDGHDNLIALDRHGRARSKTKLQVEGAEDLSGDPKSSFAVTTLTGVAALNRKGKPKWQYRARDPNTGSYVGLCLFCEMAVRNDGAVFFGDSDGIVYALSPRGEELWRYQVKEQVWGKPLLLSDGSAVILDLSGLLSVLDKNGGLRWEKKLGSHAAAHAQAVAGPDGAIYAGGGGVLYALHSDGTEAWTYSTSSGGCFAATPLLAASGTVYAACSDSMLYALNPDGTQRWRHQLGSYCMCTPALTANSTVVVPVENKLRAVRPNGEALWEYDAGCYLGTSPALSPAGRIYIGTDDGRLLALKPNGTLAWAYQTEGHITSSSPALGRSGMIYIGTELALDTTPVTTEGSDYPLIPLDGKLYAIKPDGTLVWTFSTGASIWSGPVIADDGTIYVASTVSVSYPEGVVDEAHNPKTGKLFALTPQGKEKWSYPLLETNQGSAALARDGTVYIGSWHRTSTPDLDSTGQLYAFSPQGELLWQGPYGCICTPCVGADGTIYSGGLDCKLYALSPGGAVLWSYEMGQLIAGSPVIAPDGTLYVGCSDGYLYAIKDP